MTLKWSSRLTSSTPDQFDTLKATISGGTIEHGCVVSGKQISEALERYKHRLS